MIRVSAFTGGLSVPSARFRVRQLIPHLRVLGVDVTERPARFGAYPPVTRVLRPAWGAAALIERAGAAMAGRGADVTLLQREMLSSLHTVEGLTTRPRVLDVDDAIWLGRPRTAVALARLSDAVVCGNRHIAEWFSQWHTRTPIVMTAVDAERYVPGAPATDALVIGWSGTTSGHVYLHAVQHALRRVLDAVPAARLRIISDTRPSLPALPASRVDYVPWSADIEVSALQDLAVGIMPLLDTPWARGKCSFKMLTYMACAVAVVASPVGMNADVFAHGACGLPATSDEEWTSALVGLLRSDSARQTMGREGRRIVEAHYTSPHAAAALAAVIRDVAGR